MSMKSTVFPDPSKGGRTRQSEKDACDVNVIVAHHRRGGVSNHVMQKVAEYRYVEASDFRECITRVREAQEVFDALPAATRQYFSNDPARFVDFSARPENLAELVKLGLVIPKPKPEPVLGSAENPIVTRAVDPEALPTG